MDEREREREPKYLYMMVTKDEYELPLCIEDSIGKLAERVGLNPASITSMMCRARKRGKKCCYVKVKMEEA